MSLVRDVVMDVPASMSNFDLSRRNRLDVKPGLLYPVFVQEVLPGDSYKIRPAVRMNTAPVLAPLMSSHSMELSFFFVPTRLYVQSMDINRLQFTPADTVYPTCRPISGFHDLIQYGSASNTSTGVSGTIDSGFWAALGLPSWASSTAQYTADSVGVSVSTVHDVSKATVEGFTAPSLELSNALIAKFHPFFSKQLLAYLDCTSSSDYFFDLLQPASFSDNNGAPIFSPTTTVQEILRSSASATSQMSRNAIPLIAYYDIFRNYYSNTQEDIFYMNAYAQRSTSPSEVAPTSAWLTPYSTLGYGQSKRAYVEDGQVIVRDAGVGQMLTWTSVPLSRLDDFIMQFVQGETSFEDAWYNTVGSVRPYSETQTALDGVPFAPSGPIPVSPIFQQYQAGASSVLGVWADHGLVCRTYSPDLNNVWLSSDTYGQMLQSSAMNVENNQLTVQQIRTASHLLEYDERGLVAGGRYDDWVYSQFGRRNQDKLCIPEYLGRYKSLLVFDDLYSTNSSDSSAPTAGDSTTLGQLGGKGFGSIEPNRSIRFSSNEHGYIIGLFSLAPEVSYSDGYDDLYDKTTFGDIYAPALGRIGFQPRMYTNVAAGGFISGWPTANSQPVNYRSFQVSSVNNAYEAIARPSDTTDSTLQSKGLSIGYQPAWSEYMSALDRAHGAFARNGEFNYWVLTRQFAVSLPMLWSNSSSYDVFTSATSYILPWQYEYPFADQSADVTANFYAQFSFDVLGRRRISKTVMPTLA